MNGGALLILLEGQEGAGKTTFARWLVQHLGIPLYRPFRQVPGYEVSHSNEVDGLRKFGLTINTFNEDFQTAECLSVVGIGNGVVLDRSMPSALVYGVRNKEVDAKHVKELFMLWQSMLVKASPYYKPVYIHFDVAYEDAKRRCSHKQPLFNESEFKLIAAGMNKMFTWATDFTKLRVDINRDKTPEAIWARVSKALEKSDWARVSKALEK